MATGLNVLVSRQLDRPAAHRSFVRRQYDDSTARQSLGHAFAGVATELGLSPAVQFRVVVMGRPRELAPRLWDEVYRIGREAIVNACRHSGANDIEATIEYRPGGLQIMVRDNGRGMDPQQLQWERHEYRGLRGMRERADQIGAKLRILSRRALGTEVELHLPGSFASAEK